MPMRNALALYLYHLPEADKPYFLELLFPQVAPSSRRHHLEQDVHPIPAFWDPSVQRALEILRPNTHRSASKILNAGDMAVRVYPRRLDDFIRVALDLDPGTTSTPFPTLFDAYRNVLRHISNEDPRVVRAFDLIRGVDPVYIRSNDPLPRSAYASDNEYLEELGRLRHEEDAALLRCPDYASRPRVFRDVEQSTYELCHLRTSGCGSHESLTIVVNRRNVREGAAPESTLARMPTGYITRLPPTVVAVAEVERTRLQNDVRVLHDQRGALQAQLNAKTTVIETLEQERVSDRKRIAELEDAQNRTLQAFKALQRAEERRLDAYMGVRRVAN